MSSPKVAILILNWNGLQDTMKCLDSLKRLTYPDYEIILIDNGSTGNDADILQQEYAGYIKLIKKDRNYGFAEGNNFGIRYALEKGADYVLLLNNDTIVDPEFVSHLIAVAEQDRKIGILGPKIYYMEPPDVLWHAGGRVNWYLEHWSRGVKKKDKGQFEKVADVDFVTGACMLIRRDLINKIGLLPMDYFLGWEDIDYCTNALRQGFRCVYVPQSKIWHKVSSSFRKHNLSYLQVTYGIRNRFIIRRKYMKTPQFMLFLLSFVTLLTPLFMVKYLLHYRDIKRIPAFLRGMKEGIKYATHKRISTQIF